MVACYVAVLEDFGFWILHYRGILRHLSFHLDGVLICVRFSFFILLIASPRIGSCDVLHSSKRYLEEADACFCSACWLIS